MLNSPKKKPESTPSSKSNINNRTSDPPTYKIKTPPEKTKK